MEFRAGEDAKSWFRSDRFYHTGDGWWFQTRENLEQGPFRSHKEAEQELCLYIRRANCFDGLVQSSDSDTTAKAPMDTFMNS